MKRFFILFLVIFLVVSVSQISAQLKRNPQIEIYAGAGIPLGPEGFKDYYKIGVSLNAQYVFFLTPSLGIPISAGYELFTVDNDAIGELFSEGLSSYLEYLGYYNISSELNSEGSASSIRFGIGVRPYLTPPEAPTQIFLFGNATFNLIKQKLEFMGGTINYEDDFNYYEDEWTASDLEDLGVESVMEGDENKFGLGGGAGLEIPAGESFNIILQGMFNIIFTEGESTTFLGITAGLVF